MHHAQNRRESGFTLIELLVVMIIISILMAVAVPTFLSQKNNALKTQATANIRQVITAIESCSATITSGGYNDGTTNCGTSATLVGYEASLTNLKIQATAPTAVDQTHVQLTPSNQGYIVQRRINDSGSTIYFYEVHTDSGNIIKGCGTTPGAVTATAPPATGVATSKTCKTGRWDK